MPGGFDEQDIIAYRDILGKEPVGEKFAGKIYRFDGSAIYVRKSFIDSYLKFLPDIIDALLDDNEKCSISEELMASIRAVSISTTVGAKAAKTTDKDKVETITPFL